MMLFQTPPAQIAPQPVYLREPAPYLGLLALPNDLGGLLIANPRVLLSGNIRQLLCSPDSRFLLLLREVRQSSMTSLLERPDNTFQTAPKNAAPGVIEILCYDLTRGRLKTLWTQEIAADIGIDARFGGWLGKTNSAIATLLDKIIDSDGKKRDRALYALIDPNAGTVKTFPGPASYPGWFGINPSPTAPFAAFGTAEAGDGVGGVSFLKADGSVTDPIPVPGAFWIHGWSPDGTALYGVTIQKSYAIRPDLKTITEIPALPKDADGTTKPIERAKPEERLPFRLVAVNKSVVLEAKSSQQKQILCADGVAITLLPSGSGALFQASDTLFFVPLIALNKTRFDPLNAKAQQNEALDIARDVGSAILEWTYQHDMTLPTESEFKSAIGPLLKDPAQLSRFVYTPPVTRKILLTSEERRQAIGFVLAPNGRATVDCAGRAVWVAASKDAH
jgi:hypothetical protein